MARILYLTCPQHGEFDSGVELEYEAGFDHTTAMCPVGPHPVPIPDGYYGPNALGKVVWLRPLA